MGKALVALVLGLSACAGSVDVSNDAPAAAELSGSIARSCNLATVAASAKANAMTAIAGYGLAETQRASEQAALIECIVLGHSLDENVPIYAGALLAGTSSGVQNVLDYVNSAEFVTRHAGLDDTGFVTLMYELFLSRQPDAGGLSTYVTALESGTSNRGQLVTAFVHSGEFANDYPLLAPAFAIVPAPAGTLTKAGAPVTEISLSPVPGVQSWELPIDVTVSLKSSIPEAYITLEILDASNSPVARYPMHAYFDVGVARSIDWRKTMLPSLPPLLTHYGYRLSVFDPTTKTTSLVVDRFGAFLVTTRYAVPGATIRYGVQYGTRSEETLDLVVPQRIGKTGTMPLVLLIHGGGWTSGDKGSYASDVSMYAAKGYAVANVDYRLAHADDQSTEWPAQLVDIQLALAWVKAHGPALSIDPNRICAIGDSAGGQLALMIGSIDPTPGTLLPLAAGQTAGVRCVVDEFGPADLPLFAKPAGSLALFGDSPVGEDLGQYMNASPIFVANPRSAPTFITQGTLDTTVTQHESDELASIFAQQHVQHTYVTYAGGHEFSGLTSDQAFAIKRQQQDFVSSILDP